MPSSPTMRHSWRTIVWSTISIIVASILLYTPSVDVVTATSHLHQTLAPTVVTAPVPITQTIVAMGDSITFGFGDSQNQGGWVGRLQQRLTADYPHAGLTVMNRGYNGITSAGLLNRTPAEILPLHPRLAIISVGTNDFDSGVPAAQFQANVTGLINRLEADPQTLVLVVSMLPEAGLSHARLRAQGAYNAVLPRLCQKLGVGYLDEFNSWLALGEVGLQHLRIDREHPNHWGYRFLADTMATLLETEYLTGQGTLVAPTTLPGANLLPSHPLADGDAQGDTPVETALPTPRPQTP